MGPCFGGAPFTDDEIERVRKLHPLLASALRSAYLAGAPVCSRPTPAPGVLLSSPRAELLGAGSNAGAWLAMLDRDVGGAMPHSLVAMALRAGTRGTFLSKTRAPSRIALLAALYV